MIERTVGVGERDSPDEKLNPESVGREECGVADNEPLSYDLSAV